MADTMATNHPSFVLQSPDTPVSEIALRVLVEFSGGDTYVIGTAVLVSGHLAVTAGHVIEDILERFGGGKQYDDGNEITDYAIRLYQILPGPEYNVWQVFTCWKSQETDLALLHLGIFKRSHLDKPINWRTPRVHFTHPKLNSTIIAFGYHSSKVSITQNEDGGYHLELNDKPTVSTGVVEEILPRGQPSGRFTFPCYRVAARFDGGMSGGPVFDEGGVLRGIISGTLSAGSLEDTPISYVAMLWPLLRQLISINRGDGFPRDVEYPLIHLVRDKLIHSVPTCFDGIDPALIAAWMTGSP